MVPGDIEDYAAAGGEVFVFAMVISWILTSAFNPDVLKRNALKDRVGYNNLCVAWDTFPAKFIAAPLFVVIIWLNIRFMQLDFWRASMTEGLSKTQWRAVYWSNSLSVLSWIGSILIFVIDANEAPIAHSAAFLQLVVFGYCAFFMNFVETPPMYHPRGACVFLCVYALVSTLFGVFVCIQLYAFDPGRIVESEIEKARGPIPWYVCASADYAWFCCLVLQGFMRPRAPSVRAQYALISDDDFIVRSCTAVRPMGIGKNTLASSSFTFMDTE
eukprot:TRINITY_DN13036_c0_g1_i2.p1 TRINITY_DN13036_c0_g1~~TRINITY_DN13036_c0_g1_i2.p1  ORF type:complete len:272 (-),score=17.94 TRINITY_DN13036_c0_g1_i2:86-901(-)